MRRNERGAPLRQQSPRGLWIAVFGPDGVGKSAAIERLPQFLDGAFRGCDCFHFRPRFGRARRQRPAVTAPHAQRPRGRLISIGKLLCWLLDCWLGHILLVLPAMRRSRLVIFDRYLPDLLIDPVRYRLPTEVSAVAAAVVRLAPRPDLCVLLDAPANAVQRRKQELSLSELQRQRDAYQERFASLPGAVLLDATLPLEAVGRKLAAAVAKLMVPIPSACVIADEAAASPSKAGVLA